MVLTMEISLCNDFQIWECSIQPQGHIQFTVGMIGAGAGAGAGHESTSYH
jgi:hypothetical protein